eukprot:39308-Prymnesium_polylepis.1
MPRAAPHQARPKGPRRLGIHTPRSQRRLQKQRISDHRRSSCRMLRSSCRVLIAGSLASSLALSMPTPHAQAQAPRAHAQTQPLKAPSKAATPFQFQRLDHIVLRCRDSQRMLDFYVGVLGAEPERVGRMDGTLSHLRVGASLIDLVGYDRPAARRLHAGGIGLAEGSSAPAIDAEAGTLDHFAINLEPFEPAVVSDYLRRC